MPSRAPRQEKRHKKADAEGEIQATVKGFVQPCNENSWSVIVRAFMPETPCQSDFDQVLLHIDLNDHCHAVAKDAFSSKKMMNFQCFDLVLFRQTLI
jgi:hypothetical protein